MKILDELEWAKHIDSYIITSEPLSRQLYDLIRKYDVDKFLPRFELLLLIGRIVEFLKVAAITTNTCHLDTHVVMDYIVEKRFPVEPKFFDTGVLEPKDHLERYNFLIHYVKQLEWAKSSPYYSDIDTYMNHRRLMIALHL